MPAELPSTEQIFTHTSRLVPLKETFVELFVSRPLLGHDCLKLNHLNARGDPFIGSLRVELFSECLNTMPGVAGSERGDDKNKET